MKNTSLIILLTACSYFFLHAQVVPEKRPIIRPAIIVGFNATQVDGDRSAGYHKVGAHVGAGAFIRLPKNFSFNFELLYSQKGSKSSKKEEFQSFRSFKLDLDYIDIPLIFNYHDKDRAIFGIGAVYNSLVRSRYTEDGFVKDDVFKFATAGAEILAQATFVFKKRFGINLRYTYSLSNVSKVAVDNDFGGKLRNNVLTLRLMYIHLNKRFLEPNQKEN